MFHQANMRQGDTDSIKVGPVSGRLSLLQIWVETIVQEMLRLYVNPVIKTEGMYLLTHHDSTNWPIRSLRQDDIATLFIERQTRE
jgi:hypothetical protein